MIEAILSVSILAGSAVLAYIVYGGFRRDSSGETNTRSTVVKRHGKCGRPSTRRESEPAYDYNDNYGAYLPDRRNDRPVSYGVPRVEREHATGSMADQSVDLDSASTVETGGSSFSLGDFDGFDIFF